MGFHCVNCGGSMVFDVSLQQMRCEHCESTMDPQAFDVRERGVAVDPRYTEMARFTCQNCGAELESTDDSMVGFCPYCGGQSMVAAPGVECEVERIIPFKVSKEKCCELYGKYAKGVLYLPREFRDPSFLQRFTGIYTPYYEYDAQFERKASVQGEKTVKRTRRYDVVNTYAYDVDISGQYLRGAPNDGSRYLDDEISERALPFDTSKELPFNAAYLAGFYADASTTPAELYYDDAAAQAQENMLGAITEEVVGRDSISMTGTASISAKVTGHHSTLFPLWFLTWRKDDRVAYAVINGESGKVVSDLPLDLRFFGLGCVLVGLAIFALLELLVQPTPLVTSLISLLAAFLMVHGVRKGAERVYDTQVHTWDKGWNGGEGSSEKEQRKKRVSRHSGKRTKVSDVISIVFFLGIVCICSMGFFSSIFSDGGILDLAKYIVSAVTLCFTVVLLIRVLGWHRRVKLTHGIVAAVLLLLTVALNTAIVVISPVNDGWYYLGDAVCIAGLVAASVSMIHVYNLGTTRPLPKLFDREEV